MCNFCFAFIFALNCLSVRTPMFAERKLRGSGPPCRSAILCQVHVLCAVCRNFWGFRCVAAYSWVSFLRQCVFHALHPPFRHAENDLLFQKNDRRNARAILYRYTARCCCTSDSYESLVGVSQESHERETLTRLSFRDSLSWESHATLMRPYTNAWPCHFDAKISNINREVQGCPQIRNISIDSTIIAVLLYVGR